MMFCHSRLFAALLAVSVSSAGWSRAQNSSSASKAARKSEANSPLQAGAVRDGLYRNSALGFSCQIPPGWVLRTDEINAPPEDGAGTAKDSTPQNSRVLLAAFSRPPEARGEDINSSIVIAAESVASYPGLKDAAQYLEPLTEVAKAQGFEQPEDPYAVSINGKTFPRADFQKDVGSRVMHQSTLVMLARGYAVSFTFIGGTEDEVEDLIGGLSFASAKAEK